MLLASGLIIYRIIKTEIQYLLMQTSYGKHHWTPPKGHLDEGETLRDAACRETLEEAGLHPKDLIIDWQFERHLNYQVKNGNKRVTYWLAQLENVETQVKMSDEHQDYKWLPLNEANKLISQYKDMQELLAEADKHIRSGLKVQ